MNLATLCLLCFGCTVCVIYELKLFCSICMHFLCFMQGNNDAYRFPKSLVLFNDLSKQAFDTEFHTFPNASDQHDIQITIIQQWVRKIFYLRQHLKLIFCTPTDAIQNQISHISTAMCFWICIDTTELWVSKLSV